MCVCVGFCVCDVRMRCVYAYDQMLLLNLLSFSLPLPQSDLVSESPICVPALHSSPIDNLFYSFPFPFPPSFDVPITSPILPSHVSLFSHPSPPIYSPSFLLLNPPPTSLVVIIITRTSLSTLSPSLSNLYLFLLLLNLY